MIARRIAILGIVCVVVACGPEPGAADGDGEGTGAGSSSGVTASETTTTTSSADTGEPECGGGEAPTLQWTVDGPRVGGWRSAGATTPTGDVAVVGAIGTGWSDGEAIVEIRDAAGDVSWSQVYAGANDLSDSAIDVAVDDAGSVYVLVQEFVFSEVADKSGTEDARLVVLRYTSAGELVWRWEQEHPPVEMYDSYAPEGPIAVVGDRVLVLAIAQGEPAILLELDATGELVSEAEIAIEGDLVDRDIAPDGDVVAAGGIGEYGSRELWVARFDRDGVARWSTTFGTNGEHVRAVIGGAAGDTYVAWSDENGPEVPTTLTRLESDGTEGWSATLLVTNYRAQELHGALAADGDVLLMASYDAELEPDEPLHLWVARVRPDGCVTWSFDEELPPAPMSTFGTGITGAFGEGALVLGRHRDDAGVQQPWMGFVAQ